MTLFAAGGGLSLDLPLQALLALCVLFLLLSFSFSGTETAMFSLQKVDLARLSQTGRGSRRVLGLLRDRGALITTILIGNETVNVALATTGTEIFARVAPNEGVAALMNIVVVTPTLLLLSEITPKVLAFRFNTRWAAIAAWPLTIFYFVVWIPRWVVGLVVRGLLRLSRIDGSQQPEGLQEDELLTLLDQSAAAGNVDPEEVDIIENVFDFDKLTLERVMTPRPDAFCLPLASEWPELLVRCRESGFSRVPIYADGPEDVVGVLILKDLLKHRESPPAGPRQLRSLLLPPTFVPQSKAADDMLTEFLERKFHMALVVNEHGTLVGLVTLDDLLGELFGDPAEEAQSTTAGILRIKPDTFRLQAWLDVEDFTEHTDLALPEGDYHTVGGFVFHTLGRLPRRGDVVVEGDMAFTVVRMEGRRIAEINLRIQRASLGQEAV